MIKSLLSEFKLEPLSSQVTKETFDQCFKKVISQSKSVDIRQDILSLANYSVNCEPLDERHYEVVSRFFDYYDTVVLTNIWMNFCLGDKKLDIKEDNQVIVNFIDHSNLDEERLDSLFTNLNKVLTEIVNIFIRFLIIPNKDQLLEMKIIDKDFVLLVKGLKDIFQYLPTNKSHIDYRVKVIYKFNTIVHILNYYMGNVREAVNVIKSYVTTSNMTSMLQIYLLYTVILGDKKLMKEIIKTIPDFIEKKFAEVTNFYKLYIDYANDGNIVKRQNFISNAYDKIGIKQCNRNPDFSLIPVALFKNHFMLSCDNCYRKDIDLFKCFACKEAYYCSKECQKKDWKNHKKECNN